MCGSMADIQSATAEIRRGKKERRKKKKTHDENIMVCPIPQRDQYKGQRHAVKIYRKAYTAYDLNCRMKAERRSHWTQHVEHKSRDHAFSAPAFSATPFIRHEQ